MVKSRSRLTRCLLISLIMLVTGCSRVSQTTTSSPPAQTPTSTAVENSVYRATPAANEIAAGMCAQPEGVIAQVTVFPDIPDPRCLKVNHEQKLKVINQTQFKLEISLGAFTAELAPGDELIWETPFGDYLLPGVHYLQVVPCCGPEILLVGN